MSQVGHTSYKRLWAFAIPPKINANKWLTKTNIWNIHNCSAVLVDMVLEAFEGDESSSYAEKVRFFGAVFCWSPTMTILSLSGSLVFVGAWAIATFFIDARIFWIFPLGSEMLDTSAIEGVYSNWIKHRCSAWRIRHWRRFSECTQYFKFVRVFHAIMLGSNCVNVDKPVLVLIAYFGLLFQSVCSSRSSDWNSVQSPHATSTWRPETHCDNRYQKW